MRRAPHHFGPSGGHPVVIRFALRAPYRSFIAWEIDRALGRGKRLEPRIVLHPCHDCARRRCGDRCRMRRREQCNVGPSVEPERAAVQDHVWHHQRGNDHRPLHRVVRSQPARAGTRRSYRCLSPTSTTRCIAADRASPTEHGGAKPSATGPERNGQPHAATCSAAGARAGRTTTRAACAAAGTGRSDRLRYPLRRPYNRSLHRHLRPQAQQRPIIT
jgi:hypothetical protein